MNEYQHDKYRERGSHVHYWVLHKMGYRFCHCGYIKVGNYVWKPDE